MNKSNLVLLKLMFGGTIYTSTRVRQIQKRAQTDRAALIPHSPNSFRTYVIPDILKKLTMLEIEFAHVLSVPLSSWPDPSDKALQSWLTSLKFLNKKLNQAIKETRYNIWHWLTQKF